MLRYLLAALFTATLFLGSTRSVLAVPSDNSNIVMRSDGEKAEGARRDKKKDKRKQHHQHKGKKNK